MKTKKGQTLSALSAIVTALVAVAIVLTVGFLILAETGTQLRDKENVYANCSGKSTNVYDSIGCNATQTTTEAMADIPGWLPIIVITLIGGLLLSLVARFAMGRVR